MNPRFATMHAEAAAIRTPVRWRVSQDIRDEMLPIAEFTAGYAYLPGSVSVRIGGQPIGRVTSLIVGDVELVPDRVLGLPIVVDGGLPPRSIILE